MVLALLGVSWRRARRWAAEPREVETAEPLREADGASMLPATGTRAVGVAGRRSGPAFYEL